MNFYFLDKNGHIVAGEDIECESNEKAIDRGWDMLAFGDYPRLRSGSVTCVSV